ncbi:MAG TPA: hypothetical protein VEJ00_14295 [Candidatus Acidoferrales bacterium]|nr:hypothetical protein [Candidatus Acidoferrales bacterium]
MNSLSSGKSLPHRLWKKLILGAMCFSAVLILTPLTWAQEKRPIAVSGEGAKGRYLQQYIIDVDDTPGHQIRINEIQRTYAPDKQAVIEGERIVETWSRSLTNYISGIGPVLVAYNTWVTDKGNKIFIEGTGTSESQITDTGSKRGTYHGTSRFVGGTGRFAKIRGTLVDVSTFDTDPKSGYNTIDSHGQYWFEE